MKTSARTDQNDRGQAYTVEGILAATILLTAVLFSLQATVTTPTSPGTGDSTAQKRALAQDALSTLAHDESHSLDYIVRYWVPANPPDPTCSGSSLNQPGFNANVFEDTSLGRTLEETIVSRGFDYNLYVSHYDTLKADSPTNESLKRSGTPDDTAITATYPVALYDDMQLTGPSNETDCELRDVDFYIKGDAAPNSPVFGVVEVRLVVW